MSVRPEGVLLPVFRESAWPGFEEAVCHPLLDGPLGSALPGPLVTFAFDSPHSMATVTLTALGDLGITPQQMQSEALGNLGRRPLEWEILTRRSDGNPMALGCSDEFASEGILLVPFLQQAQATLGAKALLVSMPNRGVLIVQDAYPQDLSETQRLVQWTEQTYGTTNTPISPIPLIVQDGTLRGMVAPVPAGQTPDQAFQATQQPLPAQSPASALGTAGAEEGAPREHHYHFAHRMLPVALFNQPEHVWNKLRGEQARAFVETLWEATGAHLPPSDCISPAGLSLSFSDTLGGGYMAVVLRLPPARRVTEAHAVCVVFKTGKRKLFFRKPSVVRYFVLEMGFPNDDGSHHEYIAEYRADGTRIRMGDAADTSEDAILLAVAEAIYC